MGKRQVKAPKIYLRDTGLLHALLDLPDRHSVLGHPKCGASWEGFVIEQVTQVLALHQPYFWGAHSGSEIDLMFTRNGQRYGVEVKFSEAPQVTPSMRAALRTLHLAHVWVVYPGQHAYPLADNITALPASLLPTLAR